MLSVRGPTIISELPRTPGRALAPFQHMTFQSLPPNWNSFRHHLHYFVFQYFWFHLCLVNVQPRCWDCWAVRRSPVTDASLRYSQWRGCLSPSSCANFGHHTCSRIRGKIKEVSSGSWSREEIEAYPVVWHLKYSAARSRRQKVQSVSACAWMDGKELHENVACADSWTGRAASLETLQER